MEIRDVTADDLPALYEHQRDPEAARMAAFTPRDEVAFRAHWTRILADPAVVKKAIVVDGEVVGNLVAFRRDGRREVGYWIARAHWGRGIASAALARFVRLVPDRPLHAVVARRNPASIRVLEKCGFAVEAGAAAVADPRGPEVEEVVLRLDASPGR